MRRYILPSILVLTTVAAYWYINTNAPKPNKRRAPPQAALSVDVSSIAQKPLQIVLTSLGQVSAKNTSVISSQNSGRVIQIGTHLADGAFFKKGDLLLQLDAREQQNNINTAKANLTQAQQDLKLEQAQVAQAKADWKRLNKNKRIPALVSRTPQVLSAKAKVSAAHADFDQSILDFERAKIVAPFDGKVLSKNVSIGDFVNANAALATIISTKELQVRLSLKNSDLAFINLPETNSDNQQLSALTPVIFSADLIEPQLWHGQLVRTEASIDEQSQQLFVIAQINQPFAAKNSHKHPLKIGQYLSAKIQAKRLPNAISIDIKSIYQGQYVYLLKAGVIHRQNISILWQDDNIALIGDGLKTGDLLVNSILTADDEGSAAQVTGAAPKGAPTKKGPRKKGNRADDGSGKRGKKPAAA